MDLDFDSINAQLRDADPGEIVRWALSQGRPTIATTSFGKNAAVMLHAVSEVDKTVPTVWVVQERISQPTAFARSSRPTSSDGTS